MDERELYEISKRSGFIQEPGVVSAAPYQVIHHTTLKYEYDNKLVSEEEGDEEGSDSSREPGNWVRVNLESELFSESENIEFTFGRDFDLSWLPTENFDGFSWSSMSETQQQTSLYLGEEAEPREVYDIRWLIVTDGNEIEGYRIEFWFDNHDSSASYSFNFESNINKELVGTTCALHKVK